jgi:hypothetical protein
MRHGAKFLDFSERTSTSGLTHSHFLLTFSAWFPNVSRGNILDFSEKTNTSVLTPQTPFSPGFFLVVSECVTRQNLEFSERTSTSGLTPRSTFSPCFSTWFVNASRGNIWIFQKERALPAHTSIPIFS